MPTPETSTDPKEGETNKVLNDLTSNDVQHLQLAKEIALFNYNEVRLKSSVIEQRAFNLMQFAKVGLTIIAGIAGLISNSAIHDTPFRESLIILLAIASVYLAKLFWRGLRVVRVGTFFKPHPDTIIKPDFNDLKRTQSEGSFSDTIKTYVAHLVVYADHTSVYNNQRVLQLQSCYVNTFGFLFSFFLFFVMSLVHLFMGEVALTLPEHRMIGCALMIVALTADWLVELMGVRWTDAS